MCPVDLCQNPLTVSSTFCLSMEAADGIQKEPKLKRARQIPEWDLYDREIAEFAARISGNEGALAASVDDLAGSRSDAPDDSPAEDGVEESVAEVPALDDQADLSEHKVRIDDEL